MRIIGDISRSPRGRGGPARPRNVLGDPATLRDPGHDSPLVLVFDDIHWGEATFLDLVEHIADWTRDAPILLLCMARPELLDERPAWAGGKPTRRRSSSSRFTAEESGELVEHLLGEVELPADGRERGSPRRRKGTRSSSRSSSAC